MSIEFLRALVGLSASFMKLNGAETAVESTQRHLGGAWKLAWRRRWPESFEKPGSFARWARRYCCGVRAAQLHKKQENMAAVVENAVRTSARNRIALDAREN